MRSKIVMLLTAVILLASCKPKEDVSLIVSENTIIVKANEDALVTLIRSENGLMQGIAIRDPAGREILANFNPDGIMSFKINDNNIYELVTNVRPNDEVILQRFERIGDFSQTSEIYSDGTTHIKD